MDTRLMVRVALGSLWIAGIAAAQNPPPTTEIDQFVDEVLRAKAKFQADNAYRALFKAAGEEGLRSLESHRHDSIAIQAAWEEVTLTVPEKEPEQTVRPDRDKLAWFLGFLEGRARTKAPAWWVNSLLDSRANRRDNIYPGRLEKPLYHEAGLDDAYAPLDTTLKREADQIVLRVGKESVHIPEDLLDKTDDGKVYCSVSAVFTPARCFVAVHEDVGYHYELTCIERATEKVAWKSDVWATYQGGASGIHEQFVTVKVQDERVFVFASAATGMHVEAFRQSNGRNLFRFATTY